MFRNGERLGAAILLATSAACSRPPPAEVKPTEVPGIVRGLAEAAQGDVGTRIGGGLRLLAVEAQGRTLAMQIEVPDVDTARLRRDPGFVGRAIEQTFCPAQAPAIRAGARVRASFVDRTGTPLATTLLTSCPGKA